jgi:FMN reductase [NAD(P)H]
MIVFFNIVSSLLYGLYFDLIKMSKPNIIASGFIMNETLEIMASHASVRKFKKDDIPDELLYSILNAARQAPTSSNIQAYSIIVVKDKFKKTTLAKLCGNQKWVKNCSVFLVICPDLMRLKKVCNRQKYEFIDRYIEMFIVATVDASLVAQNILLGAESCGLGGVMIGSIRNKPAEVSYLLELPDKVYPLMGICLGWPDTQPMIKPRLQANAVIFNEKYDDSQLQELLNQYDEIIRKTGLYDGPRRKVPSPTGKDVLDDKYSWCEHTARRLASTAPDALRTHIRNFLLSKKFGLE